MVDIDNKISEFNEAKFQIVRLNYIWSDARKFRENGELGRAKSALESAEVELSVDIEKLKDKGKDYTQKIINLNKDIEDAAKQLKAPLEYRKLLEKEKLLRKIQDEAGKGARYKDVDEDDIE